MSRAPLFPCLFASWNSDVYNFVSSSKTKKHLLMIHKLPNQQLLALAESPLLHRHQQQVVVNTSTQILMR